MSINIETNLNQKVALITGAAQRLGAMTARFLHAAGANIIIHYRHSENPAQQLCDELNQLRENSAQIIQADLLAVQELAQLIKDSHSFWSRLDILVNNASSFYPTPIGQVDLEVWDDLMGSNLKAPFFLSQAASNYLKENMGCIVNIVDIHATRPMAEHSVYNMAKAGLAMQVKTMARELGPEIRVNGIAPGAILWPVEADDNKPMNEQLKKNIIDSTYLKRQGTAEDIARTALFLVKDAPYITGQIIAVDGGRSLSI
ncbi:MAG: pteridine reductase [Gammaproteobacteria bacterium]|nr:pteridine reductase [Gammaproteobacteria bacterium]